MRFTPEKTLLGLAPRAGRRIGTGRHARSDAWCEQRPAGALCLLFNASKTPVEFPLPAAPAAQWRLQSIPAIRCLTTYFRWKASGRRTTAADIGSSPAPLRFSRAELCAESAPATQIAPAACPVSCGRVASAPMLRVVRYNPTRHGSPDGSPRSLAAFRQPPSGEARSPQPRLDIGTVAHQSP